MVNLRKSLRTILEDHYDRLKENYLGSRAAAVPIEYRSNFVSYKGASDLQFILANAIPTSAKRVLVIGVFGGRDYFFLKTRGDHEVHAVDLQAMPGFDNLEIANIEESLPYPEKFFDAIVMSEVIEHLVEDARALKNVRNVLADDGILFLSVPFLHEQEQAHVRVHTRLSVIRLLSCCGFEASDIIERPGLGFFLPLGQSAELRRKRPNVRADRAHGVPDHVAAARQVGARCGTTAKSVAQNVGSLGRVLCLPQEGDGL